MLIVKLLLVNAALLVLAAGSLDWKQILWHPGYKLCLMYKGLDQILHRSVPDTLDASLM
ncbi:hypothetical protein ABVS_2524 [Acinetobacter lwoffii]|nr:hypothetical protein ABEKA_2959 [Acinetobacter lwoffii]QZM13163.1 hypothetical protein ABVS_2524 [Acinetobacter lwoffii]